MFPKSDGDRESSREETRPEVLDVPGPLWWPESFEFGDPYFYHVPHTTPNGPQERVALAAQVEQLGRAAFVPDDVAFVIATNRPKEFSSLRTAYEKLGVAFYVVASDYHPWDWWAKVGPLIELLESGWVKEKYIVFTDADDMFPIRTNFSGLVDAFRSYNASMVLGGTDSDHPPMPEVADFEKRVYPWSKFHQFGQSSYMAETRRLLPLLRQVPEPATDPEALARGRPLHPHFDDQAAVRSLHARLYPDIKVDSLCKIFVRSSPRRCRPGSRSCPGGREVHVVQ